MMSKMRYIFCYFAFPTLNHMQKPRELV